MASTSVEITEAEHPITILAYEFVPDKAGAGKYRGGTPYRRDYRFLEAESVLQVRSDRRDFRPYGLYGGYPGQPSWNYLNPDGENCLLPSKVTMTIPRGTVLRHEVAGAGGWGDPLERDPAAALKDVRNELVSLTAARELYDVIIDVTTWTVEAARTQQLRADLQAARGWTCAPGCPLGRAAPAFCCSLSTGEHTPYMVTLCHTRIHRVNPVYCCARADQPKRHAFSPRLKARR